jgi:hypothetical protein
VCIRKEFHGAIFFPLRVQVKQIRQEGSSPQRVRPLADRKTGNQDG